jgi:hypothetical protein
MTARTKSYGILVVLLVAAISTACGGSPTGPDSPGTGVSPTPAPRVVVGRITSFTVGPMTRGIGRETLSLPSAGMLEATVSWDGEAEVQAFLFNVADEAWACDPARPSHANCPEALASGVRQADRSLKLTYHGVAGRTYFLNVRNRGPIEATGRGEIGLFPD